MAIHTISLLVSAPGDRIVFDETWVLHDTGYVYRDCRQVMLAGGETLAYRRGLTEDEFRAAATRIVRSEGSDILHPDQVE
jgi:hypothetical protein